MGNAPVAHTESDSEGQRSYTPTEMEHLARSVVPQEAPKLHGAPAVHVAPVQIEHRKPAEAHQPNMEHVNRIVAQHQQKPPQATQRVVRLSNQRLLNMIRKLPKLTY